MPEPGERAEFWRRQSDEEIAAYVLALVRQRPGHHLYCGRLLGWLEEQTARVYRAERRLVAAGQIEARWDWSRWWWKLWPSASTTV